MRVAADDPDVGVTKRPRPATAMPRCGANRERAHPAHRLPPWRAASRLRTSVTRSPPGFQLTRAWSHVPGAAGSRGEELAMGMRLRHRNPVVLDTPTAQAL